MNLLITGAWKPTVDKINALSSMGYAITEMPDERNELPCAPENIDAVICNGLFLYHPIEKFTNLKLIQLTSAGMDRVPVDYVKAHNITLYNAAGVYSIPMAEYAVNAVMQFYKHNAFFVDNQKEKNWIKKRDIKELYGKNVCIFGCGNVGTECAKRFKAFGCKILGVDVSPRKNQWFDIYYSTDKIHDALIEADVVIISLPLTEETRHLFDYDLLSLLKDECVLINISRGAVIDTSALIHALETRPVFAALDVFEQEPLEADSPLWAMENVIITPHNSFAGEGNGERLWEVINNNLGK
ncbi:MAG: hydroxyacid dehydrogenase [Clostridia bacterium]|nr:hydroxyacid dehydrogenase [Clostridia bacterium]